MSLPLIHSGSEDVIKWKNATNGKFSTGKAREIVRLWGSSNHWNQILRDPDKIPRKNFILCNKYNLPDHGLHGHTERNARIFMGNSKNARVVAYQALEIVRNRLVSLNLKE
ncbi:hypothetical protein BUALT_Bualt04G0098600 [Buddleja alternifolia]|uniref:Uncharacterized protein n=1 Tax=Buddleja alternifolia TaxID=168488 RepID=A0AAV6XYF7_9LAMI|nr:hypothetical protein BUALT_Bualt04G0098600 [Buddleja alternifolia]